MTPPNTSVQGRGGSLHEELEQSREEQLHYISWVAVLLTSVVAVAFTAVAVVVMPRRSFVMAGLVSVLLGHAPGLALQALRRARLSLLVVLVGDTLALTTVVVGSTHEAALGLHVGAWAPVGLVYVFLALAALVIDLRAAWVMAAVGLLPLVGNAVLQTLWLGVDPLDSVMAVGVQVGFLAAELAALTAHSMRAEKEAASIQAHLGNLELALAHTREVAEGDLRRPVVGGSVLLQPVQQLKVNLVQLIGGVRGLIATAGAASHQLSGLASEQSGGATEQAAALAQARATVSEVSASATAIAEAALQSSAAVEESRAVTGALSDGIVELLRHTERIDLLLHEVRGIADKSDLLALNASLEGVRAGEAGRGFSLVAAQMQQLAVRVRETVDDLQQLNAEVAAASEQTSGRMLQASHQVQRAVVASAAIREQALHQGHAIEQVEQSMVEISEVAVRAAGSSRNVEQAATEVSDLVRRLDAATERFRLPR